MRLFEKEISVDKQIFWGKLILGLLFISIGVFSYYSSITAQVIQIILLLGAIIIDFVLLKGKLEKNDEMSAANLMTAKAKSSDIMSSLYVIAATLYAVASSSLVNISILKDFRFSPFVFFILIGIQYALTGVFFRKLEAE